MAHHGTSRYATPNAAAQIPECLRTPFDTGHLHSPRGCSCVQACFAEPLKNACQKRTRYSNGQQISHPGESAANKPGNHRNLPAATVCQWARDEPADQGRKREDPDDKADGLIRPAEIVADMGCEPWKNSPDTHESQERSPDKRPEATTKPTLDITHSFHGSEPRTS